MKVMYHIISMFLIGLAIFELFTGLQTTQSAPQETVVVALGCFLLILARIAQSAGQNYQPAAKPAPKPATEPATIEV